jgi:hypothetical protein
MYSTTTHTDQFFTPFGGGFVHEESANEASYRPALKQENGTMKKLFILVALAFALTIGAVTVMTVHPHQAMAEPCTGSNC